MTVNEKVAHLKGVIEGMDFDTTTKEGKLIGLIVDILSDVADELIEVEDDVDTLFDYADELDGDLGEVEQTLFGDEDDIDDECSCGCHDEYDFDEEDDEDDCCDEHCSCHAEKE
jgi:hypothetical protein